MDINSVSDHLREGITDAPAQAAPSSAIAPRTSVDGHEIVDASHVPSQADREAIVDAVQRIAENVSKQTTLKTTHKITEVMDHADKANDPDGTWRDVPDAEVSHMAIHEVSLLSFLTSIKSFNNSAFDRGADHNLIHAFQTYSAECNDAYRRGATSLALSWQDAVETSQRAIDANIKKNAAPEGSGLRSAWDNIERTNQKLATIKADLIEADAMGNKTEVDRLTMLMKDCQSRADLRGQFADALQRGDSAQALRLSASDLNEVFEKIEEYQSAQQLALEAGNEPMADYYQANIETCGRLLRCKQEATRSIEQGTISAETSQAFLKAEQRYRNAIDVRARAYTQETPSWDEDELSNFNMLKMIALTEEKIAGFQQQAARALNIGDTCEAHQCQETAELYEKVIEREMNVFHALEVGDERTASTWHLAAHHTLFFSDQQAGINNVLSSDAYGARQWKNPHGSDFNKRLEVAIGMTLALSAGISLPSEVLDGSVVSLMERVEESELQHHLIADLQLIEKATRYSDEAARSLTNSEGDVELNHALGNAFRTISEDYASSYGYKLLFYLVTKGDRHSDAFSNYWLKNAEYSEKAGDASLEAVTALKNGDENILHRWSSISGLRHSMVHNNDYTNLIKFEAAEACSLVEELVAAQQQCEQVVSLKEQAIQAVQAGADAAIIQALDQQALALQPLAQQAMFEIRQKLNQ